MFSHRSLKSLISFFTISIIGLTSFNAFAIADDVLEVREKISGVKIENKQGTGPTNGNPVSIGSAYQGDPGPEFEIVVKNTSEKTLFFRNVQVSQNEHFTITQFLPNDLAAGEEASFKISLKTELRGAYDTSVYFNWRDQGSRLRNNFLFKATGTVLANPAIKPEIQVRDEADDIVTSGTNKVYFFQEASEGSASPTLTFRVNNLGLGQLSNQPLALPNGFFIQDNLVSDINGEGFDEFTIALDTSNVGIYKGWLEWENNDANESPFRIQIEGTVNPDPETNPDIAIFDGEVEFQNSKNRIYFGTFSVAQMKEQMNVQKKLTIKNVGGQPLFLETSQEPEGFSTNMDELNDDPQVLQPNETAELILRFEAQTVGNYSGAVRIYTNDQDERPFDIRVKARVLPKAADIAVFDGPLSIEDGNYVHDFGTQALNDPSVSKTFTVKNEGDYPLFVYRTTTNEPFSYDYEGGVPIFGESLTILSNVFFLWPNQSKTLTVQMNTAEAGEFKEDLKIYSTDPNENPFDFVLTGTINDVANPTPEIAVFHNANELTDGVSSIDFGNAFQGDPRPSEVIEVRNVGTADLTTANLNLPAGFVLAAGQDLNAVIAPGANDTFVIEMLTDQISNLQGDLNFANNDADENPYDIELKGNILPVPVPEIEVVVDGNILVIGEATIVFDSVVQGEASPTKTVLVKNIGTAPLETSNLNLPAGFSLANASSLAANIAAGASDTFEIQYSTAAVGPLNGTAQFNNNDSDEDPFVFDLQAEVLPVPTPEIEVSVNGNILEDGVTPVNFGSPLQGSPAVTATITVKNIGAADLTTANLVLPAGYSLANGTNLPALIEPGQTDTFDVQLSTAIIGEFNAEATFDNNDADENPFNLLLRGEVKAIPVPEIQVLADGINKNLGDAVSFGEVLQNAGAPEVTISVKNIGTADLTTAALNIPAGFMLKAGETLAATIAAGANDTFVLQMPTATAGDRAGNLSFTNNDADESPFTLALSGKVLQPAEVAVSVDGVNIVDGITEINFGSPIKDTAAPIKTITVTNLGEVNLTTANLNLPAGYSLANASSLAAVIAPGANDTFEVQLSTANVGTFNTEATFDNNDTDENPFNLVFKGEVLPVPVPEIEVEVDAVAKNSGDSVDFENILQGAAAPEKTITVKNVGTADLTTANLNIPAGFNLKAGESLAANIAPGASDSFVVVMPTATPGSRTGNLSFDNNDANENPFTLSLSGSVLIPQEITVIQNAIELTDGQDTVSFGPDIINSQGSIKEFTVRNDGDETLTLGQVTVPNGFIQIQALPAELISGQSAVLAILLDTSVIGTPSGELQIANGDTDENPFDITLQGEIIPAPAPEIVVELVQDPTNQNIVDGETVAIEFGNLFVGDAEPEFTFLIKNIGNADLDVTYTNLTITDNPEVQLPDGFVLTQELETTLAPNASGTFKIKMETAAAGNFNGDASFVNTDSDENPFNFAIEGSVAVPPMPEIRVSLVGGGEIVDSETVPQDFGNLNEGDQKPTKTFLVENTGTADLTVAAPTLPVGFNLIEPLVGPLAPGASDSFSVELDTTTAGNYSGDINIANNDSNENPYNFAISGVVIGETTCPDGDDNLAGTEFGLGLAFVGEPINFATGAYVEPQEVCLTNLGVYNPDTGERADTNFDNDENGYALIGKYLTTSTSWATPDLGQIAQTTNDFRFDFRGADGLPPEIAIAWASEVNMYHHINQYRSKTLSTEFFQELGLSPEIENNMVNRQFRKNGYSNADPDATPNLPPAIIARESNAFSSFAGLLNPSFNNGLFGFRSARGTGTDLPRISNSFDPGFVVGEYVALLPNWISGTNKLFPSDANCLADWGNNIAPCLNDGINYFESFHYTGASEVWRTYSYFTRMWNDRTCGTENTPPCERGRDIDNVMMFKAGDSSGDQTFPFLNQRPAGITQDDAPIAADRTGLYFSAIFFDIAKEVGLGTRNSSKLLWKTLSLVTDVDNLSAVDFGNLILTAAGQLWSGPNPGGKYGTLIIQALGSRGLPVNGATSIYEILESPIGDALTMTLFNENARFGSLHPDEQSPMPTGYSYGTRRILRNGYTDPDSDFAYLTLEIYKHSKYGPCDKLMFSDGTFNGIADPADQFGEYNNDGNYLAILTDRAPGNLSLFVPGNTVNYVHHRNRCQNEEQAAHFLDVDPFGFHVTKRTKNGFSFTVMRTNETDTEITYELSIVDPSLSLTGPRTGAASYSWNVSTMDGSLLNQNGMTVSVTLPKNEPITIIVDRNRAGIVDQVKKTDRSNDLDRHDGHAFKLNCLSGTCN